MHSAMEEILPTVTIPKAIDAGLANLKANFWPYMLIIVILGILESLGKGDAMSDGVVTDNWAIYGLVPTSLIGFVIGVFIKPVFDFGAKLIFVKGNRDEEVDVREIVEGFNSRAIYIDIILTNIIVMISILAGFICLILPGIYVACRIFMAPYLVMDKGLAPQQAIRASWTLTRDYWVLVLQLGILSFLVIIGGLILLVVGMIPAFAWTKAMFASLYQQILDAHDVESLQLLDITP